MNPKPPKNRAPETKTTPAEDRALVEKLMVEVANCPPAEAPGLLDAMPEDQLAALIEAAQAEKRADFRAILGLEPVAATKPAKSAKDEKAKPTRRLRVYAGPCPRASLHKNTRVYRTDGAVRYCVCDDCGRTWKKTGPVAAEPAQEVA